MESNSSILNKKINSWTVLVSLLIVLIAVLVLFVAYNKYFSSSNQVKTIKKVNGQVSIPNTVEPIEDNVVFIGRLNNKILLRYNGEVYSPPDYNPHELTIEEVDQNSVNWLKVIDGPVNPQGYNEPFSLGVFPNNQKAAFVMRWSRGDEDPEFVSDYAHYRVFVYDFITQKTKEISEMNKSENPREGYFIPIIDQISNDGRFISFNMHACWNCDGGGHPETLLYSLDLGKIKRIGRVLEFEWNDGSSYQYKEYEVIPCSRPQPGVCNEDPGNLPYITGRF